MISNAFYGLCAPAKVNLFLHLIGRLPNGYHALQSVFALLDWHDHLDIECLSHTSNIERMDHQGENVSLQLPSDDLCVRAAKALQQATGCHQGARIGLYKHLPAQAGLGAGSSDAATVLMALNRLWELHLSRTQLAEIALGLGADVPFFLQGQAAWVEGIGERITPITLSPCSVVVVKPPQGVDTASVFRSPDLSRNTPPLPTPTAQSFLDLDQIWVKTRNDLQPVAQHQAPDIHQALTWLMAWKRVGYASPRMTGSGSAVFTLCQGDHPPTPADLPPLSPDWIVKKTRLLSKHPYFDLILG